MLLRNKIAIVVVGVGIGLASAYVFGTSDAYVARTLHGLISKYVRAPCSFEGASFTYLHGIEVRGLVILDPDDPTGQPLVAADRALVDYTLDVLGAGPHMTYVELERPRVRLDRDPDGRFAIARAFVQPEGPGTHPVLPHVVLRGGELAFSDPSLLAAAPVALSDIVIRGAPRERGAVDLGGATIDVSATTDVLGELMAHAVVNPTGDGASLTLDFPSIHLDPSLPRRFAGPAARTIADASPSGEATAHVTAELRPGGDVDADVSLTLRGVSLRLTLPETAPDTPPPKPIEISDLSCTLHYAAGRVEAQDLALRALGAEIRGQAALDGLDGPRTRLSASIAVKGLPATREFRDHLPVAVRRVIEAYDITGTIDANVTLRGDPKAPSVTAEADVSEGHVCYVGYLHDDGKRYGFPWAADQVTGRVAFDGSAVKIDASGRHGPARVRAAGAVKIKEDGSSVPDVTIDVEDVPLDADIGKGFGDRPDNFYEEWHPSGTAKHVHVHVSRDENADRHHDAVEVTIDCDGRAAFRPRVFPMPLREVTGRAEVLEPIVDGRREALIRVTEVRAKADGFSATVSGDVRGSGAAQREDLRILASTEDAGGEFRVALHASPNVPQPVKDALRKLGIAGALDADVHVVSDAGGARADTATVTLRGASITGWDDVPLAARNLTGRASLDRDVLTLEAIAGNFVMGDFTSAFTAKGRLLDISGKPQFDVHVESPEMPLGEPLHAALGPLAKPAEAFWAKVAPTGAVRAAVVLDLRPDTNPTPFEVTLSQIHGTLRPLGLELDNDGEGTLHYDTHRAEVRGLETAIGAASLHVDTADLDMETGVLDVHASIRSIHFPEDLEGLLSADAVAKIADTAPNRAMHALDLHVVWDPRSEMLELTGAISLSPRVRHALPDPGLAPEGTLNFDRLALRVPKDGPVSYFGTARADGDFAINAGLAVDRFSGPCEFSGGFEDPARFDFRTSGASLRVEEYPLRDADVTVTLTPRGPRATLKSEFMGGAFTAQVGPGDENVAYRGQAHLHDALLERILTVRGNPQADVATGKVDADLEFVNATGAREALRGTATLAVKNGQLVPIPMIAAISSLDVFANVVTLGMYGRPMFTDAYARFDLNGRWLEIREMAIKGPGVVADGGEGKIGLDGGILDISIYPRLDTGIPVVEWILGLPRPRLRISGTLRNPKTALFSDRDVGIDRRREPAPVDDTPPQRDPW
jgi:hypothetical protein